MPGFLLLMTNLHERGETSTNNAPEALQNAIINHGEISPDGAILRLKDLNRTVDMELIRLISDQMVSWLRGSLKEIDREKTVVAVVESSGNILAGLVGERLDLPVVIIKKGQPKTLFGRILSEEIHSFTRRQPTRISVERKDIKEKKVIIIDDFAATGETLEAVEKMAKGAEARILAICVAISKPGQGSKEVLGKTRSLSIVTIEEMGSARDGSPAMIKFAGMPPQQLKRHWGEG